MAQNPSTMASKMPKTMRAWTHTTRGKPSTVLRFSHDVPTPPPPTGSDILIRITHTALGPGDITIMSLFPLLNFTSVPHIPGFECAGVVTALGPAARRTPNLPVGTPVFCTLPPSRLFLRYGAGMLAEFVVLPPDCATRIPDGMKPEEAAGMNGNGQTAIKLVKEARVKKGDRVLVNGASGGVGTLTLQIARAVVGEEGFVVGVCSAANAEMVKGLGADEVIDYTARPAVADNVVLQPNEYLPYHLKTTYSDKPFDVILDTIGSQPLFTQSADYLAPTGIFANAGAYGSGPFWTICNAMQNMYLPRMLGGIPRKFTFFSTIPQPAGMVELVKLVEEGVLRVPIDGIWKIENALEVSRGHVFGPRERLTCLQAFERVASRRAKGKVVLGME